MNKYMNLVGAKARSSFEKKVNTLIKNKVLNKYADLLGKETMVQILSNAFSSGRIAHAYMWTGERGIGKTTTARLLDRAWKYSTEESNEQTMNIIKHGNHDRESMEKRKMEVWERDVD